MRPTVRIGLGVALTATLTIAGLAAAQRRPDEHAVPAGHEGTHDQAAHAANGMDPACAAAASDDGVMGNDATTCGACAARSPKGGVGFPASLRSPVDILAHAAEARLTEDQKAGLEELAENVRSEAYRHAIEHQSAMQVFDELLSEGGDIDDIRASLTVAANAHAAGLMAMVRAARAADAILTPAQSARLPLTGRAVHAESVRHGRTPEYSVTDETAQARIHRQLDGEHTSPGAGEGDAR